MFKTKRWIHTKLLPMLILNKEKRKMARFKAKELIKPNINNMKIGVSYSVWDAEELLEASIKSVRKQVDYINVVWQKYSWKNQVCDKNLPKLLQDLKDKKLIDNIIYFEHKGVASNPTKKEREKRNVGLKDIQNAGCNYYLIMDADEFYIEKDFIKAKEIIIEKDLDFTACAIFDYCKSPNFRKKELPPLSVPFICKISKDDVLGKNKNFYCNVDGTRTVKITGKKKFFYFNDVIMHHMTLVRKDINKKTNNASCINENIKNNYLNTYNNLKDDNLEEYGFIKVKNIFNIKI